MKFLSILFTVVFVTFSYSQTTINYPSKDKLQITADLYSAENSDTFILLFHQAGSSRGEYKEIAPKLNDMGFSALAVDQRSGNASNGIKNETNALAKKENKKTSFIDAYQDIEASIAYVKATYSLKKIIIWGSSYSSSLVLKYAGENTDAIQAVLSFSPGEYFGSKTFISECAKNINVPTFITSAKNEKKSWSAIYDVIDSKEKEAFIPKGNGNHGSSTLWSSKEDHEEYWNAVTKFLKKI